jgi:hypothetical protein
VTDGFLTPDERARLTTILDRVLPGAAEAGGVDYVDRLLCAFDHTPPHIWANATFDGWLELGAAEELAWRIRIEGTQGLAEREFNGPVAGWRQRYREGLAAAEPDAAFEQLCFEHAAESLYGDPAYGGNRDRSGWQAIGFDGPVQPRGWTDDEVTFGGRGGAGG